MRSRAPFQRQHDAAPDPGCGLSRVVERAHTRRRDGEVALRASAARRRRLPFPRRGESLRFEAVERRVDRAGRELPPETRLRLLVNRPPVAVAAQAVDGDEDRLLEHAEDLCHAYIVDTAT